MAPTWLPHGSHTGCLRSGAVECLARRARDRGGHLRRLRGWQFLFQDGEDAQAFGQSLVLTRLTPRDHHHELAALLVGIGRDALDEPGEWAIEDRLEHLGEFSRDDGLPFLAEGVTHVLQ